MRAAGARRALGALALLVLCAAAFGIPARAFAGTLEVRDVTIESAVQPDGTLQLTERRTIDFQGDCTYAYWDLNKKGSQGIEVLGVEGPAGAFTRIEDAAASESRPPDTYMVQDSGDTVRVTAFYRLSDTVRDLTVRYRAIAAATRWADTSDLYWQFLPADSDTGIPKVDITVKLPPGVTKSEVKAFGHGPLTGRLTVAEDGTVRLLVDDLPARTFVETRILFPASALPAAAPRPEAKREEILREELDAARAADAERKRARVYVLLARVVGYGLPLAVLGLAVWLFGKHGREYKPAFEGRYFREDPGDLHPAIVGALWRMGGSKDEDIAATLMDMANRGLVAMRPATASQRGLLGEKSVQTYELMLDRSKLDAARSLDRSLAKTLFDQIASGDSLTIEQLKDYAKAHAKTFADEMSAWKAEVRQEVEALGIFERAGRNAQIGTIALGVLSVGAAVALGVATGAFDVLVFGILASIPVFVLGALMQRRSKAAAEMHAKYEALRNYLRDFSRLDEAPPASVVLWNHFLVLAVVFGIAEQVIEEMRVRIPEVVRDPAFATTYWWAYSGAHAGASPVGSLQSGFASAAQVANSQMSSTGGGGGFSGGGGGGGGGSSFGGG